jgi:hypothetical protein
MAEWKEGSRKAEGEAWLLGFMEGRSGCMGNIWAFMGATTGPLGAKTESSRTVLSA